MTFDVSLIVEYSVYTGKFRNRKVAIAEFRGHLTASKYIVRVYWFTLKLAQWTSRSSSCYVTLTIPTLSGSLGSAYLKTRRPVQS